MKEIKLTQGFIAFVDNEDFERVNAFKWNVQKKRNTFYAKRNISLGNGKQTTLRMHRFILNISDPDIKVDHLDHNGLNCQKENLRTCDNFGNAKNQIKSTTRKFTSKYKGVYYSLKTKFTAKIMVDKKSIHLGTFKTENEAAIAYNEASIKYHKEYSHINIIE